MLVAALGGTLIFASPTLRDFLEREESGSRGVVLTVYADKLASKVADADNAPGGPGAITAALYLQAFAGDVPWVHVDFASVGEAPTDRHEWTAGPTGFGPRLLLSWLGSDDPLEGLPAPSRARKKK